MYAIYKACARFGIRPPGVKDSWEDIPPPIQARLLQADQGMEYDELKQWGAFFGAKL
jgi:hypothetical protein